MWKRERTGQSRNIEKQSSARSQFQEGRGETLYRLTGRWYMRGTTEGICLTSLQRTMVEDDLCVAVDVPRQKCITFWGSRSRALPPAYMYKYTYNGRLIKHTYAGILQHCL